MNVPILIIGAGPVGMTMASELARYGVPIRIIDAFADAMTEVTIGYPGAR
jgi:2-polyprenyl-6-methoxyphenol hydroxylase-like FAD-dependent oxidoreductase